MRKILVIGRQGQVAQALKATQPNDYRVDYLGREALDIRSSQRIAQVLQQESYELVINASGYTQVDAAETDSQAAFALNHLAVKALAECCAEHGVRLIHLSSDYVFDGRQNRPYRPDDTPHPLNLYGESKWHGELAVLSNASSQAQDQGKGYACIVRTAWLYSAYGQNFVKTMLKLMAQGKPVKIIDDQWGTPTSAIALSEFIWQLTELSHLDPIYHWSDLGVTNWYEFARETGLQAYNLGLIAQAARISPTSTQDYGAPAPRPPYSALDCSQSQTILPAKPWQVNLSQVLQQLLKEG